MPLCVHVNSEFDYKIYMKILIIKPGINLTLGREVNDYYKSGLLKKCLIGSKYY